MVPLRALLVSALLLDLSLGIPSRAQPAWSSSGPWPDHSAGPYFGSDPREGRIEASRFVISTSAARELGRGAIDIAPAADPDVSMSGSEDSSFRDAVAEQLGRAGYAMAQAAPGEQLAEVSVRHASVQPPQPPHSPIAGEVAVGGGNRGSGVGVAIALDFRKPLKALIATRLEVRIRDRATEEILWEGHAEVLTREGDKHWNSQVLASRLAAALFRGFPHDS